MLVPLKNIVVFLNGNRGIGAEIAHQKWEADCCCRDWTKVKYGIYSKKMIY